MVYHNQTVVSNFVAIATQKRARKFYLYKCIKFQLVFFQLDQESRPGFDPRLRGRH